MYRKIGKDRACDSRDILADRQTDTQTHIQTCLSQYLANRDTWPVDRGMSDDLSDRQGHSHIASLFKRDFLTVVISREDFNRQRVERFLCDNYN